QFSYDIYAGASQEWVVYWGNVTWEGTCMANDTFCWTAESKGGWTLDLWGQNNPNVPGICNYGSLKYAVVDLVAPCDVSICDYDTIIVSVTYSNNAGECDDCGDCLNPDYRPSKGWYYYSADTLILHVVESPPALYVAQDSISYVDQGQTQAYIEFQICNGDLCAPETDYYYSITSKGHIGSAINVSDMTTVSGGLCGNVYGVIDAEDASVCDYDTLTIIAWTEGGGAYDTCVQIVHAVEPQSVPLFTKPVVTILVLALILVAAIFLRRRMKGVK
ncbi:MAG: hypothetical protein PHD74_08355, partial [Candidatus Krumholzibacteria bacterium]|nr:hypothetical protein [Candidatus Krumholzibacteria bacterium]